MGEASGEGELELGLCLIADDLADGREGSEHQVLGSLFFLQQPLLLVLQLVS
jgi:hypothetical protein